MKHESIATIKCGERLYEKSFETMYVKGKGLGISPRGAQEVNSQKQAQQSLEGTPGDWPPQSQAAKEK